MDNNCIFCKIAKGEIPSPVVYEDDKFFGFLDMSPVTKGHSLLIPKEHHVWIHETSDEILSKILIIAKKIINNMRNNLKCDYVQISIVGTEVPHFHIHLIPRHFGDGLPQFEKIKYESDLEKKEIASKIKNAL